MFELLCNLQVYWFYRYSIISLRNGYQNLYGYHQQKHAMENVYYVI